MISAESGCIQCGGTGYLLNGDICDCTTVNAINFPVLSKVPIQYQGTQFDKSFLSQKLDVNYGIYLEDLLKQVATGKPLRKNFLICSPPNTGKTVFAYTLIGMMYSKGVVLPELMDLIEVRDIMLAQYKQDYDKLLLINTAPIMLIKLPSDLPSKFGETISLIIERRVRNNGSTIFLFGGNKQDLLNQDRFGKLSAILGDGNYNSLLLKSWKDV